MIIQSILDTDQYKFSMQQAIAHHYPRVEVEYEFINRSNTSFPEGFGQRLRQEVDKMRQLFLTGEEESFLRERCYYLKPHYVDMVHGYRYNPEQVDIRQIGTQLFITIRGPWYLTVLWEVPLLAIVSELYYKMTDQTCDENYTERLRVKLQKMTEVGCLVSDFGSRRRFSLEVHDQVIRIMKGYNCCTGTSNTHLAQKYNLTPIGTMAHEWIMGHACMFGYRRATPEMLKAWIKVYEGELGIALPDTFTTKVFLPDFNTLYAKLFDGSRWDSGDWKWFTDLMVDHWKRLRIDPGTKTIVYSDALTDDRAIEIQQYAKNLVRPRFGIGTFLTNDVGSTPLNIVIKLTKCDGHDAVKLSDSPGKELGTSGAIAHCKYDLGLQ
ncbi:MAG: nicotinate phosphoribosyltransferase [Promethearchaeota archaeon]|jgi:nicotinate phosphoribosyltransferase